ncbi:molybdopterin-dependent oxidoreductase [Streptomyces sp. G-G2]|uniref:molybdopterin-dependent oxidoreductase n=1 Tax=Streptomyces sp. G-G2 TaxID=3046201 RepID=UPI0024BBBFAD|nr:molybdopterin-dependent oxidoreductase [Streptomyces sp. G-G2]MDJ0385194.1 molybdopterin-dependent oxidoreductase [Streptomyces sp. G-G2]
MAEEVRGFCTLCKSRCGAVYTVERGRITSVRPDGEHPTGAAMCPKGRSAPEIAHSTRRLTRPLRRTHPKSDPDPGWEAISWDEALDEIAAAMTRIAAESGPEAVAFAVATPSGTSVSDATEWIERLVRHFGSPNTLYSAEICNWHKDVAHGFTFGSPLPPPDYANADLALLWGFNPAKTWLAQAAALSAAQARGMELAVVDPRRSTSALSADHWLRVRPGTDAALALGLAGLLIENGSYDEEFVRAWSDGPLLVRCDDGRFLRAEELAGELAGELPEEPHAELPGHAERFVVWDESADAPEVYDTRRGAERPRRFALAGVRDVPTRSGTVACVPAFQRYADACAAWPPERVARTTWIPEREIRALADRIGAARSVAYYGWTGVGQHANASQTERALATLSALTGCYDAPGGNAVVSPPPYNAATDLGQFPPGQLAKALGRDRHPLGPQASGYVNAGDLCRAIEEGDPYPVRALIGFGSNAVVAQPGSDRVARALLALEFQVHLDLFHNPTSASADIVLPVNSAWEREALRFGFEADHRAQEHVQLRPRVVAPQGESRSDTEVVFALAQRLGMGGLFFDGDVEAAWNWQLEPLGLTVAGLRAHPGGIRVPKERRHRGYAETAGDGAVTGFRTPTRRVEFYAERLAEHGCPPVPEHREPAATDAEFPLVLTGAKHGYFVHSQHRGISSLRRRSPDPVIDLHPRTAAARGIAEGEWTVLSTRRGGVRFRARLDGSLHPAVVVAEYGWWQEAPDLALPGADPLDGSGSNVNLLVDSSVHDPLSGSVPLRSSVCEVRRATDRAEWNGPRAFTVTAIGTEDAGAGVRTVALEPADGGPLPDYRPGQHVTLRREGPDGAPQDAEHGRSYSLTGPAVESGRRAYRLAVRQVPDGVFSGYVHERLRTGDRLHLTSPGGTFALPTDTDRPVVLLAGGIGITPFLSYLETLAVTGGSVPRVVLHHGNRSGADHPFRERIAELDSLIPALTVVDHYAEPGAGDPVDGARRRRGFLGVHDLDPELVARRARFCLCGPEPMTAALTEGLLDLGVPRFEIFSERFQAVRRDVAMAEDAEFTVRFARSGREVTWRRADGTLLDLGTAARVRMASGCRLGQCESCVCTVLQGEVAHLVTPSDDVSGTEAPTCQSVPATDLVLDC